MSRNRLPLSAGLRRLLIDSSLINGTLGIVIMASLAINAEMWLNDYPPTIKEAFGTKNKKAQV